MAANVFTVARAFCTLVFLVCLFLVNKVGPTICESKRESLQGSFNAMFPPTINKTIKSDTSEESGDIESDLSKRNLLRGTEQFHPSGNTLCTLSDANVTTLYNKSSGVWVLDNEALLAVDNDVQLFIDCANDNDTLLFRTSAIIKPKRTLSFSKNLTIGSYHDAGFVGDESQTPTNQLVRFTCPESEQLILAKSPVFTLRDLSIEGCVMSTSSIIVLDPDCKTGTPLGIVRLVHVLIKRNKMSDLARILNSGVKSCFRLEINYFRVQENVCVQESCVLLSSNNTLKNIQLLKNEGGGKIYSTISIFLAPRDSDTTAKHVSSVGNDIQTFRVSSGYLNITDSRFYFNWVKSEGSAIFINRKSALFLSNSLFSRNRAIFAGSIYLKESSNGTVTNCTFTNNLAVNIGGAILMSTKSTIALSGSMFSNNMARVGGSIHLYNSNSGTISNCTFTHNEAKETGGAIVLFRKSTLVLFNSTFSNNKANIGGSTFLEASSNLTATECSFTNSIAANGGGAIVLRLNCALTLYNSTFTNNTAPAGGSIMLSGSSYGSVTSCAFRDNTAVKGGGAIVVRENSDLVLVDSAFSSNGAENGGSIYLEASSNGTVINCTFTNNLRTYCGGAIAFFKNSNLALINSTFSRHEAHEGGSICIAYSCYGNFLNCTFTKNAANEHGGAIWIRGNSTLIIFLSSLEKNEAKYGGSIHVEDHSHVTGTKTSFINNKARSSGGGMTFTQSVLLLNDCYISGNEASYGGGIYTHSSNISLLFVKLNCNNAKYGGVIYCTNVSMNVKNCILENNHAQRNGGSIYVIQTKIMLKSTQMHSNKAVEDCGGICAYKMSFLNASNLSVRSNSAGSVGGGMGIFNASTIICISCMILNNKAMRGAGLHIYSDNSIPVVAQLQNSRFENNSAKLYGGGIDFYEPISTSSNFSSSNVTCGHIILLSTNFVNNFAKRAGAAILSMRASGIRIDCEYKGQLKTDFFTQEELSSLKTLDTTHLCKGWKGNHVLGDEYAGIVGTYGQKIMLSIAPDDEVKLSKQLQTKYILENVSSGKQLPIIHVTVLDEFGMGPAPTIPPSFEARLSSQDGFFSEIYPTNVSDGCGSFSNVSGFAKPGNYSLKIELDSLSLGTLIMALIVRKCRIGEEPTKDKLTCRACDKFSYNFNTTKVRGCKKCPLDASCNDRYIVPNKGYWHKSPCHDTVHKCHLEDACNYDERHGALTDFTANFTNCNATEAEIEAYNDKLCNQGYKGPLCGSCKKSYGLSSSFECIKCGDIIISISMIIAIICYLLFGTCISINGALPLDSNQNSTRDEETPLLETRTSPIVEDASTSETRVQNEDNTQSTQLDNAQARDEMDAINRQLSEMWKVVLNFFQVISTAATMDIKWTSKILKLFEKLQVLGAATVESISVPIDCIVSAKSNDARVIWRCILSLLTPIIVIVLLSFYWGVRYIYLHRRERLYFVKRLILTIITVTYITYFDLTQVGVRAFDCVSIHNKFDFNSQSTTRVWIVDTSIDCYEDSHRILIGIALFILILVSMGFPLFCSLMLFMRRSEVYTPRSWAHETLGFLCGPFKANFIYWECITMIKKALLSIVIVFSYSLGNQIQGLLILLILVFFLYIHFICYPYKDEFHTLNYYESGSLLVCCMTYTLVQFFNVERCSEFTRTMVSLSIIFIISSFLCLVAYKIISDLVKLGKAFLRSKDMTLVAFIKSYLKKLTPRMSND